MRRAQEEDFHYNLANLTEMLQGAFNKKILKLRKMNSFENAYFQKMRPIKWQKKTKRNSGFIEKASNQLCL